MTNEEILLAAQNSKNKKGEGEAEIYHYKRAVLIGNLAWIVICFISCVLKTVNNKYDHIEMVYVFILNGVIQLYLSKIFHDKKKLILGIVFVIVAVVFFVKFWGVMFA